MSGYTPVLPTPTLPPCDGQPWRVVGEAVECLSQPLAQSGLGSWSTALYVGLTLLVVGLALTAWSARRRARRAS